VPSEYHRSLIGTKGATIRKLSEDYNVQIKVPNQEQNADIIKVIMCYTILITIIIISQSTKISILILTVINLF